MASQNFEPIHFPDFKDNNKINAKNPLLGSLCLFFVFFTTFLFLYFIYACARRRHHAASTALPEAGLDPASISSLPVSSFAMKPSHGGAECAICLSIFQEGERVKVLPLCRHGFHSDCVDEWLRTRSSCPLCRGCVHRVDSLEAGMWVVPLP
ncbi:RING-H2 finger protein ATL66-like [Salvia hispanica]|uniref:RING-H2 finger protein ATL66-like n=1 Tax=Salvia hispanica TaxID=49212 RepID=UPI0020090F96|nr:RING-H2 finger protein ATL66-like [Salvia hispanica]